MKIFCLSALLALGIASNAFSNFSLSWSGPTTSTGGAPIVVSLILTETTTSNISNFGLAGGSVQVTRTGDGVIDSFSASPLGAVEWDFSYATSGIDPVVGIEQTSLLGAGIGSNAVTLGSFTINPSLITDHSGTLSVSGFNNLADDIAVYTDLLGGLDNLGTGTIGDVFATAPTFSYSFTAVPEPTTLGAAMTLFGSWVLRRRKRNGSYSLAG